MSRAVRVLLTLAVCLLGAGVGFHLTTRLAPERLEQQVLAWLEHATDGPVEIASLRVGIGLPIRLEGSGLRLWGGALTAEEASARFDVVSLLLGHPRVTQLRLDGAHLSIEQLPEGSWHPPIFGRPHEPDPEPALRSLQAIEGVFRLLLAKPFLADTLVVRRSRVTLAHPAPGGSGEPVRIELESVSGRLLHSRLFGDARLFLRLRAFSQGIDRGVLEWNGRRTADGSIQVTTAATGFDLALVEPYLKGLRERARLAGAIDGVIEFGTATAGEGTLEVDLGARGVSASLGEQGIRPLAAESLSIRMGLDLNAQQLRLRDARIRAGDLDFDLEGAIERPLGEGSPTRVTLGLADLPLDPESTRSLAGWLPEAAQERFLSLTERLIGGRLVRAEVSGDASLGRWRDSLAGRFDRLPDGFALSARVDDVAIQVDEANRLDRLGGDLAFADDTLTIEGGEGALNGGPLPGLDLSFRGLSHLLESPVAPAQSPSGARALVGLTPLWELLRPTPDPEVPPATPPRIALQLDRLSHPALLWPMSDLRVELQLETDSEGMRFHVSEARWAGAIIDGDIDWWPGPERQLGIRLVASSPPEAAAPESPPDSAAPAPSLAGPETVGAWASGRVEVGPFAGQRWQHRALRARIAAVGGEIRLDPVEVELEPGGLLVGRLQLDLSQPDRVPYRTQVALRDGDAPALTALFGADPDLVEGRVALGARLAGTLVPGRPLLHDADGRIGVSARDGSLRRAVPPMLALALASGAFNPFASVDRVRYERIESRFEVSGGVLSSKSLELDGPDLRLFASGSIDLHQSPATLDAEVVLFLFRQLDRALELIPLVNVLLLGENQNLLAAYFELVGTWDEPVAKARPLRTLEEGPTDLLTSRLPGIVNRGIKALGGLLRRPAPVADAPAAPDAESPAARSPR